MPAKFQNPFIEKSAVAMSGQITVAATGTAVQGPNIDNSSGNGFAVSGMPANTKPVYIGNDGAGDVSTANGFPLNPGDTMVLSVRNLNEVWFDVEVNGEKIAWLKL